ncbi:MAG: hypothetical protein K2N87_16530 [Eubacterium sp.]|nr:hypothetical protein [Eubacterium sp.]
MDQRQKKQLKHKIRQAQIVSFDLYGTLIFRTLRQPQDIFAWMECAAGMPGLGRERERIQVRAARFYRKTYGVPHPTLCEIYRYWAQQGVSGGRNTAGFYRKLEAWERKLEEELCIPNQAMQEMLAYARQQKKRVIFTTDMYLEKPELERILKRCSLVQYDAIYASSELKKTKYDGTLYDGLLKKENVSPGSILHIGDDRLADVAMAAKKKLCVFWYRDSQADLAESLFADLAKRRCKGAYAPAKAAMDFWYLLGYQVGGPLYMGLCNWLVRTAPKSSIYALSRDGYNIARLLPLFGKRSTRYLLSSRNAWLLPHMTKLGRQELELLPPYSCGQTIREALGCAGLLELPEQEFQKAGFGGYEDVLQSRRDIARMKQVYRNNKRTVLQICARERRYMEQYLCSQGADGKELCFFDSGWHGTSQYLMEHCLQAMRKKCSVHFCYAGMDAASGRHLLRDGSYSAYLNLYLGKKEARRLLSSSAVLELFFSQDAPPLKRYGKDAPVFDSYAGRKEIRAVNQGLFDYVRRNLRVSKAFAPQAAERFGVLALRRLVLHPSRAEAQMIGDLADTDGMSSAAAMKKYIAKIPADSLKRNPFLDIYWEQGVYRHPQNSFGVRLYVWLRQRTASALKKIGSHCRKR